MNGAIFHKNSEIRKAAKQEKTKEKCCGVLQLTHPCFSVCNFLQEVCLCGGGGTVFSHTNKLEPLNTQSSVKLCCHCGNVIFPSMQSSAGILLLRFEWI